MDITFEDWKAYNHYKNSEELLLVLSCEKIKEIEENYETYQEIFRKRE